MINEAFSSSWMKPISTDAIYDMANYMRKHRYPEGGFMLSFEIRQVNNGYAIEGEPRFPPSVAESLEDAIKLALELCNFEDGEEDILAKLEG